MERGGRQPMATKRGTKGRVLRDGGRNVNSEAARHLPATQLPHYKDIGLQVLEFEQTEGLPLDEAIERTLNQHISK